MKFEMNCWTVGLVDKEGLIVNKGLVERQMTLLGYRVNINTNKPDGIVQLGRDSIDLTYTDNIRGSLKSLVYAAKRREGGMIGRGLRRKEAQRVHFGPGGAFSVRSKETPERTSGRTFRALLDVMKTASESPENSLTVFVSMNETCKNIEYRKLVMMLENVIKDVVVRGDIKTITLPGNRRIMVVTKNQSSKITEPCHVIYDHTVQGN